MQLGIFAKTFARAHFEEGFGAARALGFECIQFNLGCAGLPVLPEFMDPALAQGIRLELQRRSLFMAAISGTCNLIHPNEAKRAKDIANLKVLISACRDLGSSIVTLCTGTRDANDMWRAHPENRAPEAWRDLVKSLESLLPLAQEQKVSLGIEPEPANVIDSAAKARSLLDELKSPCLKIVFDAANLLQSHTLDLQDKILSEAVDRLGKDIVVAHAKDLTRDPGAGHVAAGKGCLDYGVYLSLLHQTGFKGPFILHSLREEEVPAALAFLKQFTNAFLQPRQP